MPRYDYDCAACGRRFELMHGVHADPPTACALCGGGPVRKAFAAPAIHFKGSGWAKKERRATVTSGSRPKDDGASSDGSASDGSSQGGSSDSGSSDGTSTKPEPAAAKQASSDRGSDTGKRASGSSTDRGSGSKPAAATPGPTTD